MEPQTYVNTVAKTPGLIAFWEFSSETNQVWLSHSDPQTTERAYPLKLKRIGDPKAYSIASWPYQDTNSCVQFDTSGPFGRAVRFNKGYIYGVVERTDFDRMPLDICGKRPFTLIAWVKFIGARHLIAGIWDEGGWNKYGGQRQVALFAGLFGQKGVIAHVSATGAASYPQSMAAGAQYARSRAIDGKPFPNNAWVVLATTFDPEKGLVTAYLDGVMTPLALTDDIIKDVYQFKETQVANPFEFRLPLYSPRAFVIKYNGYNLQTSGFAEHRLFVDLERGTLMYEQDKPATVPGQEYRLLFDILRKKKSLLSKPVVMKAIHGQQSEIGATEKVVAGDEIFTTLECHTGDTWEQVGKAVTRKVEAGAPFTFGRALGLGKDSLESGSQLFVDGVAVFNRVLTQDELKQLNFKK